LIEPLSSPLQAEQCARIMSTTDPWLTLGRGFDECLKVVSDPDREIYVATDETGVTGFLILQMRGTFVGYIQTVAVRADQRRQGLGTTLIEFAEERIFRDHPNVFMCVSSFNPRAKELYLRLGYSEIGEIPDFIVRGHSEILLRKTIAPLSEWRSAKSSE
jgi:ribosomal protein S18 acetylase RimI-like enzyme